MQQKKYSAGNIFAKGVIGNVRKAQEDSHGFKLDTPNGDLFVVCDGMGGHVGGAKASSLAVDSIIEYINKEKYATPIDALNGALQFANMQILGFADANPEYKGMGTTACLLLLRDDGAWIAHVGDSRIYLYLGKEKKLHRITKDHSFVQSLVDAGEITDEEAEHHPNKNRILKALGIKPELSPTFNYENRPILPKSGDIFLICSDGLSGMIPDSTIEKVLGQNLSFPQKGERLIDLAMKGETVVPGGQDNCTVELIEIEKSAAKKSVFHSYNPNQTAPKNKKKESKIGKKERILIIAILVLALGIGAMVLLKPNQNGSSGNNSSSSSSNTTTTGTNNTPGDDEKPGDGKPVPITPPSSSDEATSKRKSMSSEDSVLLFETINTEISNWNQVKESIEKNVRELEEASDPKKMLESTKFGEMKKLYEEVYEQVENEIKKWGEGGYLSDLYNLKPSAKIKDAELERAKKAINTIILPSINKKDKGLKSRLDKLEKKFGSNK